MARYHLNTRTGNPGLCRAVKRCPFGDLEQDHYNSKAEAPAALEQEYGGSLANLKASRGDSRELRLAEENLPKLFAQLQEERFVASENARLAALQELRSKAGEHWYSNGVVELNIYNDELSWGEGYRLVNSRSIAPPTLRRIFKAQVNQ